MCWPTPAFAPGRVATQLTPTTAADGYRRVTLMLCFRRGLGYYVVFNNKFSHAQPKTVQIDLNLRYNQWVPDWC